MNTYAYYVYYGRDRDDWSKCTTEATCAEEAYKNALNKWCGTGYTVKRSSFKPIDNQ